MSKDTSAPAPLRTIPMGGGNLTFMVEKLGDDCAALQFVRELTQNSIESIRKAPGGKGELRWDVAWPHHALTGAYKLAVIDTGIGMTGEEMVGYINNLSSSVHEQSRHGNFGVGAKIAALPRNPNTPTPSNISGSIPRNCGAARTGQR